MDESFGKEYKLCSQKIIEQLFQSQQKVKQYPFVLHYSLLPLPTKKAFQVVISVPKKLFRKAHERNRIKRLMREAFRRNKNLLENKLEAQEKQVALFMIYTANEELNLGLLDQKIKLLFAKLLNDFS